MSTRLQQRQARLRAEYGFDFPDDFYQFWEFANRVSPLEPLHALAAIDLVLVGPFDVLAGRLDGQVPRHSLLLHWRYHDDPPEFFTTLVGGGDGLHFGYFLDDPERKEGCTCSYYARDAYELSVDGDTIFESVRLHLEYYQADVQASLEEGIEEGDALKDLEKLRNSLLRYATADRPEIGEAYTERYAGVSQREPRVVAETCEGMGIVVPREKYRPLSLREKKLWQTLRKEKDKLPSLIEEARQALREGYPGTALELGKNLWATGNEVEAEAAYELLDAAYAALERETLRRVLHTHRAQRDLPSVDILEPEE